MKSIPCPPLLLEPLTEAHAAALFKILADPRIYEFLDYGPPASVEALRGVYTRLEGRQSADGQQLWLNWVVFLGDDNESPNQAIGTVQATVLDDAIAWIGYVFSPDFWGKGYASLAVLAMLEALELDYGVRTFLACIEAQNDRSARLLKGLGFLGASPEESQVHDLSATERLYMLHA